MNDVAQSEVFYKLFKKKSNEWNAEKHLQNSEKSSRV